MRPLKKIVTRQHLGIALAFFCLGAGFFADIHPYASTQQAGACYEKIMQSREHDLIFDEAFDATGDKKISLQVTDAIQSAAEKENIDPLFLAAVIKQESNFRPYSASSSGGTGLMMVSENAAKGTGLDRSKLADNVEIGAMILHRFSAAADSADKNTALKAALIGFYCGEAGLNAYDQNPDSIDPQVMTVTERVMANYQQLSAKK